MPRYRYEVNVTSGWRLQEYAAPVAVGGTFEADETPDLVTGVEKGWLIRHGMPRSEPVKKGRGKNAKATKREPQPPVIIEAAPGVSTEATQPAESGIVGDIPLGEHPFVEEAPPAAKPRPSARKLSKKK